MAPSPGHPEELSINGYGDYGIILAAAGRGLWSLTFVARRLAVTSSWIVMPHAGRRHCCIEAAPAAELV